MKLRRSHLVPIGLMVALVAAVLACPPRVAGAEGLNAEYARLANSVVPSIERIAGRYFSGTVEIKGVPQSEMRAVLVDDMRLGRVEQLSDPELARRSGALSEVIPVYYSIARHRIYFSADTVRQKLKDGRLNPTWENDALRLMLAHELVRFLDDQQTDLKKLLGSAGSVARVRAFRAMTAGHARMVTEIISTQWNRPGAGELVSRWSLGEGAGQGLDKATSQTLDEEFSFCFDGGYRFASYIYDNFGADGFYRAYGNPPVSASVLYNPAEYKFEKTAEAPSSPTGGSSVPTGTSGGEILSALKEAKQFLPAGEWIEQSAGMKELMAEMPAEQREVIAQTIEDWNAVIFLDTKNIRFVIMQGFRMKSKVSQNDLMQASGLVEQSMVTQGKVAPEFQPPVTLSGLSRGSGWLRNGKVSDASSSQSINCWIAMCSQGQYMISASGINCTISEKEAASLCEAVMSRLP